MKIGILSSGGDCPGINAAIHGLAKVAMLHYGMEVVGIRNGFQGLLSNDFFVLDEKIIAGILNLGGTILGTSREKPFRKSLSLEASDKPRQIIANYQAMGFDAIACIGGNGTQKTAYQLSLLGLNIISIPKTIDNDIWGTDICFGFTSAVNIATEAIDRLHSTASAHKRVMLVEFMGHHAGWITLYAGMAGGADIILIPEQAFDLDSIVQEILRRVSQGKSYIIVAMAEGIDGVKTKGGAASLSQFIEEQTGIETRETVLGYVQRGGNPSPYDRNLATRLAGHAAELISKRSFASMVCLKGDTISSIPLSEVAGKTKLVQANHDLILQGKRMGVFFGASH